MNEKEAAQHARDIKTVERAVKDERANKYDGPVHPLNPFPSDKAIHDEKVYKAAWRESHKSK